MSISNRSNGHKIVILGSGAVGKSAITIRMVVNEFRKEYDATIEDSYTTTIEVDGKNALLDILDTAGQEQFKALRAHWIKEADAFLLVYAVNSQTSFKAAHETYKTICREKEDMRIDMVLVGNKTDLAESQHQVTYKMGQQLADSWGCPFITTSAKTGDHVTEAFNLIVREIRKKKPGAGPEDIPKEKYDSGKCACT
eukprot:CAMPEP_0201571198 /NCGR_PEP_ID=MMETSP0190_2-20130828/13856_1 /ASSEMBLY_ACC=CAM_ASM_000263 /TAXON_ID=37353 /ORGANISM="Rosalina sp." /LENGTH=196 /DNA_ID=CAMNT_0047995593 /DNA_START=69 /DNA_END=655 /DNA_ORIENTATION=+